MDKLRALLNFVQDKYAQADKELDNSFEPEAIAVLQFTTDALEDIADKLKELITELENNGKTRT